MVARIAMPDADLFEYDQISPLDVVEAGVEQRDGARIHDITYASPMGGRVPAYLIVPDREGRFAGLVLMHWGFGSRGSFLEEALLYARAGAVCLTIEGPFGRPIAVRDLSTAQRARDAYLQLIIDLRRAVDLLFSRLDVSSSRIGYVGHSLGASVAGALALAERRRVRAFVLMGGWPELSVNETVLRRLFPNRLDLFAPFDSIRYIGHAAPAELLLQFARRDEFITAPMAEQWIAAASEPKKVCWYDADHAFDLASFRDRAEWLHHRIAIAPIEDSWLRARQTLLPESDLAKYGAYQQTLRR